LAAGLDDCIESPFDALGSSHVGAALVHLGGNDGM